MAPENGGTVFCAQLRVRKGADDVTLRAEEVDMLKACINVNPIE